MDLLDDPPHKITRYASSNAPDAAGGHATTYTAAQANIPCSIDTARANTAAMFGQQEAQEITHTIGIVAGKLTAPFARGDKVVPKDDPAASYHVVGISKGRAYDDCPAIVYLGVRQIL